MKDYIRQEDAKFSIRRFGSRTKKEDSSVLRRGFLNKVFVGKKELFSTFYVDNGFPAYFYSMAKDGYAPTDCNEFKSLIDNFEFPCGYFQTDAEKELAAFKKGQNPEIGTKGYKIAHIFSAGEGYSEEAGYVKIADFCNHVFPRGERREWQVNVSPSGVHFRPIQLNSEAEAQAIKKFAIAHFIRTVHPLNFFLVPNKPNTIDKESGILKTNIYYKDHNGKENNEIGEYSKLIEYVAAKIKDIYKDTNVYQEFLDLIFPIGNCVDPKADNVQIDAEYAIGVWQKRVGSAPKTISTRKTKTSTVHKHPPISIELIPNNSDLFKKELIAKKRAKFEMTYTDGRIVKHNWNAYKFLPSSDLMNNIKSRLDHHPDRDQIEKAVFEV